MGDLGSRLKHAREARGVDLRDIATATKISVGALEALERNDYSRLPGGIFSRSFVRAYALAVGLDPEATVNEFLVELHHSQQQAERNARKPEITADDRAFIDRQQRALRNLRIGLIVLGVLLIAAAGWAAWHWWPWRSQEAPASPSISAPVPPPAAPTPPPDTPPQPPAQDAAAQSLAIVFEFTADCWMAITADGELDVRRQFRAGEEHEVRAEREILVNAGNAGGFRWTINGKAARPLGREGTIREVRITRENYTSFVN